MFFFPLTRKMCTFDNEYKKVNRTMVKRMGRNAIRRRNAAFEPNDTTRRAIADVRNGKTFKASSVEDMLDKLKK